MKARSLDTFLPSFAFLREPLSIEAQSKDIDEKVVISPFSMRLTKLIRTSILSFLMPS